MERKISIWRAPRALENLCSFTTNDRRLFILCGQQVTESNDGGGYDDDYDEVIEDYHHHQLHKIASSSLR